jgi:ubiquinone/menaquinone biosynthesis C-methylase UbiE
MSRTYTFGELRDKYAALAPRYDRIETPAELLGLRRLRREMLRSAAGDVLEVAAGTGMNFPYYPPGCTITAVDLSPAMLDIARERAGRLGMPVTFAVMPAEELAFPDAHFATVVSSLSTCTFPDPLAALREMARVCRPEGRILLLEHGRSRVGWVGRWQDRRAERHAQSSGCWWNREPRQLVEQAGLDIISARRTFFGVYHVIVAAPSAARQ